MTFWRVVRLDAHSQRVTVICAQVDAGEARQNLRTDYEFLQAPDYSVDPWLSRLFNSRGWRSLAPTTRHSYIRSLCRFIQHLHDLGVRWDAASTDDYEQFEDERLNGDYNPRVVENSTFAKDYAAIAWLYRRAFRDQKCDLGRDLSSLAPRGTSFRGTGRTMWADPSAIRHWCQVGLAGYTWNGIPVAEAEKAGAGRNWAFVDLLLATGLRSAEATGLSILEEPAALQGQQGSALLPGKLAKGGRSRRFYFPPALKSQIDAYVSSGRRDAVEFARGKGVYDAPHFQRAFYPSPSQASNQHQSARHVLDSDPELTIRRLDGTEVSRKLSQLDRHERARTILETGDGPEPLALWLSLGGTPLQVGSWQKVFRLANERHLAAAPQPDQSLALRPHMLRHTFALVRYLAAERVLDKRWGLSLEQRREMVPDGSQASKYIQALLGHSSSETTERIYLAPVMDLRQRHLLSDCDFHERDLSLEGFASDPHASSSCSDSEYAHQGSPQVRKW